MIQHRLTIDVQYKAKKKTIIEIKIWNFKNNTYLCQIIKEHTIITRRIEWNLQQSK